MTPLTEKYRAKSFTDFVGQENAIVHIDQFYKQFPKKKAIILNGPVGTGKTSLAIALANEYNLELFELNASDLRNRISLENVLAPATAQASLFKKGKLILMDEADGITTSDRGGLPELIQLIASTNFPVIITANDIWQKKFSPLRQKCTIVNLNELKDVEVRQILTKIREKEHANVPDQTLAAITKRARGDVRAALNDFQSLLTLEEAPPEQETSKHEWREKKESIFDALKKVFQDPPTQETVRVYDTTQMELDEILLWIEENVAKEYHGKALVKAIEAISNADRFKGRIYRQQYWRFLVYQNFFLSAGIASATQLKSKRFTRYQKPSRILKIWLANQKNAKRKTIVAKYGKITHTSVKKARREQFLLPLLLDINDPELDLEDAEKKYLKEKKVDLIMSQGLNRFRK